MIAFQISPEVESLYGLGRQATKFEEFVWNFATFARLPTLKLDWVAFHSVALQLKCLDFQFIQYKKLVPVLSRFCKGL